ncbi:hypothetical protein ACHAQH_005414 [Verticillium albo-atrum]
MGLAEVKFRRKIDKDPNNTSWAKDTSTFGQKILRSQGWEPGQYLGAKDAAQAEHYTAANASFVRVSLKDDMLGLGFKQAKEERSTGMDAFQNMLARLNGKSEVEIQKEQQAKLAVASSLYCDSKFGPMRFVRGGWLVGDKVQESADDTKEEEEKDVKIEDAPEVNLKDVSKKRKVDEVSSDSDSSSEDEKAKKKRRKEERKAAKKEKSKSAKTTPNDTQDDTEEGSSKKKSKKDKTRLETDSSATEDKEARRKRKQEKKERKERKAAADESDSDADKAAKKEKKRRKKELKKAEEAKASASRSVSGTATPASGTSTPVLRGHHAVRSRWIASKRMATMDDTALNQIFGIKASS